MGAFDIKYLPKTIVKGQVLADLVAKFTKGMVRYEIEKEGTPDKEISLISTSHPPFWELCVDGATNQKGSGIGIVLVSPKRVIMEKSLRLGFLATNNEAEYKALRVGLDLVKQLGGKAVEVFFYSRFIVGQVKRRV